MGMTSWGDIRGGDGGPVPKPTTHAETPYEYSLLAKAAVLSTLATTGRRVREQRTAVICVTYEEMP